MASLYPTPQELAREAREAWRKHPPKEGRELYIWLVQKGFINARGQVTRLIGGSAEPEPHYETWTPEREAHNGAQKRPKRWNGQRRLAISLGKRLHDSRSMRAGW